MHRTESISAFGAFDPRRIPAMVAVFSVLLWALAACGAFENEEDIVDDPSVSVSEAPENEGGSGSNDGFLFFGGGSDEVEPPEQDQGNTGDIRVGVNIYLWRAALDTLAFMPMMNSDPFGGVIITDWYADPQSPTERFKVTVYVLDGRLRADGLRVSLFRQVFQPSGVWMDAVVNQETITELEDTILTGARRLRIADLGE